MSARRQTHECADDAILQVRYLTIRAVRTRRFAALSVQRILEILFVAILAGLFWFQRGNADFQTGDDVLTEQIVRDSGGLLFFQVHLQSFNCNPSQAGPVTWWGGWQTSCCLFGLQSACRAAANSTNLRACHSKSYKIVQNLSPILLCVFLPCPALYAQLLFMSFSSMFQALFTFPLDMIMLLKERQSSMYRLSAYYLAKILWCVFQAAGCVCAGLSCTPVVGMVGMTAWLNA
eukprot:scaffold107664_cov18-Tisochrysis_lutea.AAC.1